MDECWPNMRRAAAIEGRGGRMRTFIARSTLTFLIVGPIASQPLAAQRAANGSVEGTVARWITTRAVQAAKVSLVQLESDASNTVTAAVDPRGRYRVDSLPVGAYLVQVSHPTLDSLDVTLPPGRLAITAGRTTRSDFSLPSADRLRKIVCPGVSLGAEKAVIAGRAIDAETDAPLVGAKVVAGWSEITVDGKARKIEMKQQRAVVSTGPGGEYRLCGVPAAKVIGLQLQHDGRAGTATRLSVSPEEGVVVRNFSLSLRSAPTIAALDSIESLAATPRPESTSETEPVRSELALTGNAALVGVVRSRGQLLRGAEVRVRHARSTAVTDAAGSFVLDSLPAGTQMLLVRHLGYALVELPIELRPARRTELNVQMTRAVALDSVRVVAKRPSLAEFEFNRRTQLQGHFLTLSEIQRAKVKQTSELLPLLGGYVMMGRGRLVKMKETAFDPPGTHSCKAANVVIDGVEGLEVDDVLPNQIAGIELYKNAASAPLQYAGRANCGLIVIWLRPGPRWQGWKGFFSEPAKLQYNGYP
jgi:Carboxypeptidase regulatory-like domain